MVEGHFPVVFTPRFYVDNDKLTKWQGCFEQKVQFPARWQLPCLSGREYGVVPLAIVPVIVVYEEILHVNISPTARKLRSIMLSQRRNRNRMYTP